MALTLLEVYDLHQEGGILLRRVTAACGLLSRAILANENSTVPMVSWANSFRSNPAGAAREVFNGVMTDPAVVALTAENIRAGIAPTDEALTVIIQELLEAFL